jgi:hypothetical protein
MGSIYWHWLTLFLCIIVSYVVILEFLYINQVGVNMYYICNYSYTTIQLHNWPCLKLTSQFNHCVHSVCLITLHVVFLGKSNPNMNRKEDKIRYGSPASNMKLILYKNGALLSCPSSAVLIPFVYASHAQHDALCDPLKNNHLYHSC